MKSKTIAETNKSIAAANRSFRKKGIAEPNDHVASGRDLDVSQRQSVQQAPQPADLGSVCAPLEVIQFGRGKKDGEKKKEKKPFRRKDYGFREVTVKKQRIPLGNKGGRFTRGQAKVDTGAVQGRPHAPAFYNGQRIFNGIRSTLRFTKQVETMVRNEFE